MFANGGKVLDVLNSESEHTFSSRFRRCVTGQKGRSKPRVISELSRNVSESCRTQQINEFLNLKQDTHLFNVDALGDARREVSRMNGKATPFEFRYH